MLVTLIYLLVLECSSIATLKDSFSLVEGEGILMFPFWCGLGWPERDEYSRPDLGSGDIAFSSWETLNFGHRF